jgi:general secretion pathway protein C
LASIDATAKRFYPVILCGLLGTVAYLQGAGISSLVAEQLPIAAPASVSTSKSAGLVRPPDKSAQPILARNAFDSETGPLTGLPPKPPPPPPPTAPVSDSELPRCASASVVGITESDDPSFSFALIRTSGSAKMRRIGDDIDGKKLELIGWDRVVLSSSGSRCQLRMLDDTGAKPAGAASDAGRPARDAKPSAATASTGASGSADITKVSETQYTIERGGAEKMAQMQTAFMKAARVVDGQGIRIQRSAESTILKDLGMKKGDLVKTVNGFDMTQPDKAMEVYGKLKSSKKVQIVLERDGAPVTLDYDVK